MFAHVFDSRFDVPLKNKPFSKDELATSAYSTPNWTPIPRQTGHPFHAKLDSQSSANWTPIPLQTGQFGAA